MRRSQKIMSLILAALMLLSSLPGWAENEPIVIVESVETPAPQAEKTPEATVVSTSTPTVSAPEPKQTPTEEDPPEEEPAGDSASMPATLSLVEEESTQSSTSDGGQTPANKETAPASENGANSAPAQDKGVGAQGNETSEEKKTEVSSNAVSYTHLDVYKRQVVGILLVAGDAHLELFAAGHLDHDVALVDVAGIHGGAAALVDRVARGLRVDGHRGGHGQ